MTAAFGDIIREWRGIRRFSQLDLSLEAGASARHLSFLESGRAKPSRTMVLKLSDALEMPKAVANQALNAAGFSAAFPQLASNAEALEPVYAALKLMLVNHEPLPGIALDRHWDIVDVNPAAVSLFGALGIAGAGNMIDALAAAAQSDVIENWEETALLAIVRARAEIAQMGGEPTLERYVAKLSSHPRLANADIGAIDYSQAVIPLVIRLSGKRLSLFSTIAQFGTVQEIVASDIRIELMFPADDATRDYFMS